jgi:hypothetical protein
MIESSQWFCHRNYKTARQFETFNNNAICYKLSFKYFLNMSIDTFSEKLGGQQRPRPVYRTSNFTNTIYTRLHKTITYRSSEEAINKLNVINKSNPAVME